MDRYIVHNSASSNGSNVTGHEHHDEEQRHHLQQQHHHEQAYIHSTATSEQMDDNEGRLSTSTASGNNYTVIHTTSTGGGDTTSDGGNHHGEAITVDTHEFVSGCKVESGGGVRTGASGGSGSGAIDTSQFNEGVGNTTYVIDNNSSNSIDSVRIGNQSYVPLVDSSQLYSIQVAGNGTQYTIESVVNPAHLGNYIIEGPAYLVETKPEAGGSQATASTSTIYIDGSSAPTHHVVQTQTQAPKKQKAQAKRKAASNVAVVVEKQPQLQQQQEQQVLVCSLCNAEFQSASALRFHAYHHNPKTRRFTCIGCETSFEKDKEKEEHELQCDLNYSNARYECLFCDLPYNTPRALRTHENKHRPVKRTKKYKHMCVCIKCNKAFDAIYTLKLHIRKIHNGNAMPASEQAPKKNSNKAKKKKKSTEVEVEEQQEIFLVKPEPQEVFLVKNEMQDCKNVNQQHPKDGSRDNEDDDGHHQQAATHFLVLQ